MKTNLTIPILGVFSMLLFGSCVKDTDFGATDDILLSPILEVDLVYFDLEASDFYDISPINGNVTISDTTEIRFINASELGSDIERIEFLFRLENGIPRVFDANFEFLNEDNEVKYEISGAATPGTINTPTITEITENVEGDNLIELTMSTKLVVSLTMPNPDINLSGNLNLKSKATYYLGFN